MSLDDKSKTDYKQRKITKEQKVNPFITNWKTTNLGYVLGLILGSHLNEQKLVSENYFLFHCQVMVVILREINNDEVEREMPPAASTKLDKMEIHLSNLFNKIKDLEANQVAMKQDLKDIKAMVVNSMDIMRTIQQNVLLFLKEIQNNPVSEVMKTTQIDVEFVFAMFPSRYCNLHLNEQEDREKEVSAGLREREEEFGYTPLTDSFDISQQTMDRTFEEAEKIIAMRKAAAQGIKKV